ncbi:bifunctional diguanylate cyclase/phosphodiesterase [uncultured Kushneria sp.]|uniref:bifunctional diguanylate cyclase/phosphodiesterase n=1 Tax=uncultured Kushneria sp. TaxID=905033 RepID=UPI002620066B|nr:bifunctional diguanylate cyclase/phosphodiesterase [uncultured Kushneria sp.]
MLMSWNVPLVTLSYVIATLASFTALELTRQVRHATHAGMKRMWFCSGSCALGLGIWSMHFVGMLAWKPSISMTYQPGLTLVSLVMAIAISVLALGLGGIRHVRVWPLMAGGSVLGAAIATMHYTGMAAMTMDGMQWHYDTSRVVLSVAIAIIAATAALMLFRIHGEDPKKRSAWYYRLLSAGVMGLAISGMHYTGMSAMVMDSYSVIVVRAAAEADTFWLASSVSLATLMILGFTLMQLLADDRLSAQIRMGRELQRLLDSTHQTLNLERMQGRTMLNAIDDGVLTIDQYGSVKHANPTALRLLGTDEHSVFDQPFDRICLIREEGSIDTLQDPLEPVLKRGEVVHLHSRLLLHTQSGQAHFIELKASPLRVYEQSIVGAVVIISDVSFRREMMNRLEHQALHDSLTGLNNRRAFDQEILRYSDSLTGHRNHLIFFDLDHFKIINDSCGHGAGDQVLCDFSRFLRISFRDNDFIARLGGDEFAVIVNNNALESTLNNIERLKRCTESYSFEFEGRCYTIGTSIGLAIMDERFESTDEIKIAADRACYSAKCSGRNRLRIYEEDDTRTLQRHQEVLWLPRLREALHKDRFVLYAQRIDSVLPIDNDGYRHHEILLRYVDDEGQHIAPGAFLSVAERSNLMPEIDRWVVYHTFQMLSRQKTALKAHDHFSINLSGQTLTDETFAAYVLEQFEHWQLPASMICFEITETAAISGFDRARHFMETLRNHGCEFSLDDFGSGMSSFAYLAALPINHIKIDGAFVKDLVNNEVNQAIVSSISGIGRSLGLKTVAEFVENEEILASLRELGVDYAQGYGIARPDCMLRLFELVGAAPQLTSSAEQAVAKR